MAGRVYFGRCSISLAGVCKHMFVYHITLLHHIIPPFLQHGGGSCCKRNDVTVTPCTATAYTLHPVVTDLEREQVIGKQNNNCIQRIQCISYNMQQKPPPYCHSWQVSKNVTYLQSFFIELWINNFHHSLTVCLTVLFFVMFFSVGLP